MYAFALGKEGETARLAILFSDISERRRTELALRAAKDDCLATLSDVLRTPSIPVLMAASVPSEDSNLPSDVRETLRVTGCGMEGDLRRTREVESVEHLFRPVDPALLHRAIERVNGANLAK